MRGVVSSISFAGVAPLALLLALSVMPHLCQGDPVTSRDALASEEVDYATEIASLPFHPFPSNKEQHPDQPKDFKCDGRVMKSRKRAQENNNIQKGVQPTVTMGAVLLIFLFVGVFSAGIAMAFTSVRKHVYHDADNLDTAFDAGGKVSIGLTATTIVSQWTWSATLLQSSTVASKFGISGPYWYAGGATIQIIIFSILSIMLKTRAPGAKTFLQVR